MFLDMAKVSQEVGILAPYDGMTSIIPSRGSGFESQIMRSIVLPRVYHYGS
jgi:hypothetical protein